MTKTLNVLKFHSTCWYNGRRLAATNAIDTSEFRRIRYAQKTTYRDRFLALIPVLIFEQVHPAGAMAWYVTIGGVLLRSIRFAVFARLPFFKFGATASGRRKQLYNQFYFPPKIPSETNVFVFNRF